MLQALFSAGVLLCLNVGAYAAESQSTDNALTKSVGTTPKSNSSASSGKKGFKETINPRTGRLPNVPKLLLTALEHDPTKLSPKEATINSMPDNADFFHNIHPENAGEIADRLSECDKRMRVVDELNKGIDEMRRSENNLSRQTTIIEKQILASQGHQAQMQEKYYEVGAKMPGDSKALNDQISLMETNVRQLLRKEKIEITKGKHLQEMLDEQDQEKSKLDQEYAMIQMLNNSQSAENKKGKGESGCNCSIF